MTYGTTPLAERHPGSFKAFCKQGAWRDVAEVLAAGSPLEGAFPQRWNRTLERNELLVPCDVEFVDTAAFEAHMADVHDRKPGWKTDLERGWEGGRTPTIKCRPARPSREVKPLPARCRDHLRTCSTCGLIAEVTYASETWWDEHVRSCALANVGAAS